MNQPLIIIGVGEMGALFARAFLKAGHPVYPVSRQDDLQQAAKSIPDPELVLIAVAENDLPAVLQKLPQQWRHKVALLQNELLPDDWKQHNLNNPTVISVWFEKKPGQDFKVLIPSPVYGPQSGLIKKALSTLEIPVDIVRDENELLQQLVIKNLYILTTNICGLESGGNVQQLWNDNAILMNRVFDDVLTIQQYQTCATFDRDHLLNAVLTAFDGDPLHKCMGRSAPQRLQRALQIATEAGLEVPEMQRIGRAQN